MNKQSYKNVAARKQSKTHLDEHIDTVLNWAEEQHATDGYVMSIAEMVRMVCREAGLGTDDYMEVSKMIRAELKKRGWQSATPTSLSTPYKGSYKAMKQSGLDPRDSGTPMKSVAYGGEEIYLERTFPAGYISWSVIVNGQRYHGTADTKNGAIEEAKRAIDNAGKPHKGSYFVMKTAAAGPYTFLTQMKADLESMNPQEFIERYSFGAGHAKAADYVEGECGEKLIYALIDALLAKEKGNFKGMDYAKASEVALQVVRECIDTALKENEQWKGMRVEQVAQQKYGGAESRPPFRSLGAGKYSPDRVDKIIAYESGEMDEDDVINFFQEMIDDGSVWSLQGSYGRMAKQLIDAGLCHWAKEQHTDFYGNPLPTRKAGTDLYVWIRAGDGGDYESYDSPEEAGAALSQYLDASDIEFNWTTYPLGVVIPGVFEGHNYVSVYWGDADAQPQGEQELNESEKRAFENAVKTGWA